MNTVLPNWEIASFQYVIVGTKITTYCLANIYHTAGSTIQEPQDKGLKSMKRNCLKRQKNEPVRERDRTAEDKAETRRRGQKDDVASSEHSFWHENPSAFLPSTARQGGAYIIVSVVLCCNNILP